MATQENQKTLGIGGKRKRRRRSCIYKEQKGGLQTLVQVDRQVEEFTNQGGRG